MTMGIHARINAIGMCMGMGMPDLHARLMLVGST